jgi:hypothetical protein
LGPLVLDRPLSPLSGTGNLYAQQRRPAPPTLGG